MITALLTSTTESNPKPTNAIEPARNPLTIATRASRLSQPIVDAVRPYAQLRNRTH